jgi:hypothetical protein
LHAREAPLHCPSPLGQSPANYVTEYNFFSASFFCALTI